MGASCCDEVKFDGVSRAYKRALIAVILINGVMFFVEMGGGIQAMSQALKADALDFFADTATYTLSLMVIGRPQRWRSAAALFKGVSLGVMGVGVLAATIYRVFVVGMPEPVTMGVIGALALVANLASVGILFKFRDGDANVRSVWLCSRNDAIGNVMVIMAAGAVLWTGTAWPDLIVAALMATLFLSGAVKIIRQARTEWNNEPATA